jgi:membrane-bound ClpP family serine protease
MILLIGLILIGIILLVLEILVLPGMIAGIVGGLLLLFGVWSMYNQYGTMAGNIALASTIALTGIAIYASLKSKAWSRFGLKDTIDGRVNEVSALGIAEGDEGRTLSALRPSGTAVFNGQKVEAQTSGDMLDAGSKVVVVKVLPNKVLVKMKVSEL